MTTINGLALPEIVLRLMSGGRWQMPTEPDLLGSLFEQHGDPGYGGPKHYSLPEMQSETRNWIDLSKPGSILLGTPDPQNSPGDIDPTKTVLIGDIGMGFDSPIALDYRSAFHDLPVLRFTWSSDCRRPRWIQMAQTIELFVKYLEL